MIGVAVVGSLHLDIMVAAPRLPMLDETLMGSAWAYKCGGKGGNQAVAAARFGASVGFGGQTGRDEFGERLRQNLVAAGVDVSCVGTDGSSGSGMSVAITEQGGEYGAVVVSGANLTIDASGIANAWKDLWTCKVLLLQNEIREPVNLAAARAAKARGAKAILNAAPARAISEALLDMVDVLVVNRVEAAMLAGKSSSETALDLLQSPSRDVILTRGAEGLTIMQRSGEVHDVPALAVTLVSSHGAGDCFCGALAARFAAGDGLAAAAAYARTAAGLFVSLPEDRKVELNDAAVRRRLREGE